MIGARPLLRRWLTVVTIASLAVVARPVWAGTTGSLAGTVLETQGGTPIANATVTASSPSQVAVTHTDARGGFVVLSLAPDTYTIAIAASRATSRSRRAASASSPIRRRTLTFRLQKSLKTIAQVQARSSLNEVQARHDDRRVLGQSCGRRRPPRRSAAAAA